METGQNVLGYRGLGHGFLLFKGSASEGRLQLVGIQSLAQTRFKIKRMISAELLCFYVIVHFLPLCFLYSAIFNHPKLIHALSHR